MDRAVGVVSQALKCVLLDKKKLLVKIIRNIDIEHKNYT